MECQNIAKNTTERRNSLVASGFDVKNESDLVELFPEISPALIERAWNEYGLERIAECVDALLLGKIDVSDPKNTPRKISRVKHRTIWVDPDVNVTSMIKEASKTFASKVEAFSIVIIIRLNVMC
eukprot:m.328039 g.328039  ORF g.328039 m.328039 type:complete len:125 (-) comp16565_c0_seq101:4815-5189(-)